MGRRVPIRLATPRCGRVVGGVFGWFALLLSVGVSQSVLASASGASVAGVAMGVYTGYGNDSGVNRFASTTGADVAIAADYQDGSSWSGIDGAEPADEWTGSGYQLALGVPMLPNWLSTYGSGASGSTTDGSDVVSFTEAVSDLSLAVGDMITDQSDGTLPADTYVTALSGDSATVSNEATGSDSGEQVAWNPYTLAQGATGAYNSYFETLAQNLVAAGQGNAILHLGWEWDQPNSWDVNTATDAANFAAYWQQIVTTMRSVSGANFNYAWYYGDSGSSLTTEAWPGSSYVSSIDLDFYDQTWDGSCGLPFNNTSTPTESQCAWSGSLLPELTGFANFASTYDEPMGFGEWGVISRSDGHGLGDDPTFVNNFAAWIKSNNVEYANYFDYNSGGNSVLTDFPNSLAAYQVVVGQPHHKKHRHHGHARKRDSQASLDAGVSADRHAEEHALKVRGGGQSFPNR